MKKFLKDSTTFGGFTFNGHYTMPTNDFFLMYEYYQSTGINLLDDYSNMIYVEWSVYSDNNYSLNELNEYEESQSRLRRSGLFEYEWLGDKRIILKHKRLLINKAQIKLSNSKRIRASSHTSKTQTRTSVFEKYGNKCLACGSSKNICIDHVVPVFKGGKNDISNYQPLCKSCNSKKGVKVIDYRK